MKQRISLLLAAVIALLPTVSCGSEAVSGNDTTESGGLTSSADTTETADGIKAPELPELDMEGRDFTIMTHGWYDYEPLGITDIMVEEENGDSMNDAAYKRFRAISDTYNCTIRVEDYSQHKNGITALNNSIAAGDDTYQFAVIRSFDYSSFLTAGALTELTQVPNLDLDAPYYDQAYREAMALGGEEYGIVSNVTTNLYYTIFCAYFNKQLMADYNLGSIYDTIRAGSWTMDEMLRLGKYVAADLDNNGTYDTKDSYAFTYINDDIEGLLNAGGFRFAELNSQGELDITYDSEQSLDKLMGLFTLLSDQTTSFNVHTRSKSPSEDEVGMFMKRQALFSLAGIYYAPQFRDMQDDFGIIPFPKYDEEQEDYLSPMFSSVIPITVIPKTNAQLEETGILLEELSYQGLTILYPALFDILLKGKIARDDDSVEMLDLVFSSTFYDSGAIFNFGGVKDQLRTMFGSDNNSFASYFESVRSRVNSEIDSLMEQIGEVE